MGRKQVALAALTAMLAIQGALAQETPVTAFVDVQLVPMDRPAGLTPFQALSAATRVPGEFIAKFVPRALPFGQIKPGMRADLVLVSANPLVSLESLRQPVGVMSAGRWRTRQQLDALLAQQQARYQQVLQ
jgi:hypothetical protein